ncbi:hypothetical protein [Streptomyces yerevanensis]|uniref:hypothetical protein n=1 Tax=Streptomyces yerevanensis TaxID=66378 RepID=UPI0005277A77|nr:hypothetical protein [Streptomyces yerevanensis]
MKSLKAAAIVAGSLFVAGLATPAVAADAAGVQPVDLKKKVSTLTQAGPLKTVLALTKQGLVPEVPEKKTGVVGNGRLGR